MPVSERKLIANRLNALKSTGPKTPDGKARVRHNRVRHGLRGVDPVLPEECEATFALFQTEIDDHLRPKWPIETMLADEICSLLWRLRRIGRMEVRIFEQAMEHEKAMKCDTSVDALARQLDGRPDHPLMTISRYERSLRNALSRALTQFRMVQEKYGGPKPYREHESAVQSHGRRKRPPEQPLPQPKVTSDARLMEGNVETGVQTQFTAHNEHLLPDGSIDAALNRSQLSDRQAVMEALNGGGAVALESKPTEEGDE